MRRRPAPAIYTCSATCQRVHEHCRGCGVLAGPDHEHRLRDGYCAELLVSVDHATGVAHLRPLLVSCWDWQVRTRSAGGDGPRPGS